MSQQSLVKGVARNKIPGTGKIVLQTPANPAAGTNFVITVPAGKVWRLVTGAFSFTTSAFVGNRIVRMLFTTPADVTVYQASTHGTQAAGQTVVNNTVPYLQMLTSNAQDSVVGMPDVLLLEGYKVKCNIGGMDVADQISNIAFLFEEWNDVM